MAFFEKFYRRPAEKPSVSRDALDRSFARTQAAEADVDAAERKTAYAQTRLSELAPDLREEVRLQIESDAADTNFERARQRCSLAQRALELHQKSKMSGPDLDEAIIKAAEAENELTNRERERMQAQEALAAIRARIATRESEMRSRFGLETG